MILISREESMNILGGFKNFLKSVGAIPGNPSVHESRVDERPAGEEPAYAVELSTQNIDQNAGNKG